MLSGSLLIQVYRLPRYPFSVFFLEVILLVFCTCFGVFFFNFGVFWRVPGGFLVLFSRNAIIYRVSKKVCMAGAVF